MGHKASRMFQSRLLRAAGALVAAGLVHNVELPLGLPSANTPSASLDWREEKGRKRRLLGNIGPSLTFADSKKGSEKPIATTAISVAAPYPGMRATHDRHVQTTRNGNNNNNNNNNNSEEKRDEAATQEKEKAEMTEEEEDAAWEKEKENCSFCKHFLSSPCKLQVKPRRRKIKKIKEKRERERNK